MKSTEMEHTLFQSDRCRVKCIALMALAFVCALLGVFIFGFNFGINSHSQQVSANYVSEDPVTDILLVMSYDERDDSTPLARDGVLNVMSRSNVGVDVVYMDAHNAPIGSVAYENWVSRLRQKVAQHGSYGAVICADDEALYFIEDHHDSMFGSTPVVFFGVNDVAHATRAAASGYMTGMIEQCYFGSIMQAATVLHPAATRFMAIVDQTPTGIGNRGQFDLAMESFDDMTVSYVNASYLTRRELASTVAGAGEDTIVFLLDANNDSYGNTYSLDSSVGYIADASSVPVYRASMGGVGNGIAGCGYRDADLEGRKAAETTIAVLNGMRPVDIPLNTEGNLGYVFDGKVLSDYGVSVADVPAGSTVINRQILSFDTIRLIVLPVALLVIAALLFLWARRLLHQATNTDGMARAVSSPQVERTISRTPLKRKKNKQRVSYKRKKNKSTVDEAPNLVESQTDAASEDRPQTDSSVSSTGEPSAGDVEKNAPDNASAFIEKSSAESSASNEAAPNDDSTVHDAGSHDEEHSKDDLAAEASASDDSGSAGAAASIEPEVAGSAPANGDASSEFSADDNQEDNPADIKPDVSADASNMDEESTAPVAGAVEDAASAPKQAESAVEASPVSADGEDVAKAASADSTESADETSSSDATKEQDKPLTRNERRAAARARARSERRPRRTTKAIEVEPRSIIGLSILDLDRISEVCGETGPQEALSTVRQRLQDVNKTLFVREREEGFVVGFDAAVMRGSRELASIETALHEPMAIGNETVTLRVRVCVANREGNMKPKEMEEAVELVLSESAKLGDSDGVMFYGEHSQQILDEASKIETTLENAISREAFVIFYQPQIDLKSKDVVGFQAIARLKSKEYAPSLFLPVAEMTGLIVKIDRIVAQRAIEQLSKWKRRNKRIRPIQVSISPLHLTQDDDIVDFILDQLKAYDVSPQQLRVEISESPLGVDYEKAEKALARLAEAGITIVLGHFGTGYASIPEAIMDPVSIVEINRGFVSTFLTKESDSELKRVIMLAHSLEKRVIAVGIDEDWQLEACRNLECDIVQGASYSQPLLPENAACYKALS